MSKQNSTSTGPIAQHLAHNQSNRQKPLTGQQQKRVSSWVGFSGKTLWDWLQLLAALAIPLALGIATISLSIQQDNANQLNREADIALQTDQQREAVLTSYIQNIKDLVSTEGLLKSKSGDGIRVIARAQTLVALQQLDGARKTILIQFLSEAGLITNNNATKDIIIHLRNADLRNADLSSFIRRDTSQGNITILT